MDIWSSRDEISLFFRQNLDIKHFLNTEMSLEEEEMKKIQGLSCFKSSIIWNIQEYIFRRRERV